MKILCIGDVIGSIGSGFLRQKLPSLKKSKGIDLCIVNGENSNDTNGITPQSAEHIFTSGADCITTGNHCFQRKESYELYDSELPVMRPANFPDTAPGVGYRVIDLGRRRVAVINVMGLVSMRDPLYCPFRTVEDILERLDTKLTIVDFHGEATAEKRAFAEYFDGRIAAVFGTHTHVQTADEQILPKGTGFITDVGMTGPIRSCIGAQIEASIRSLTTHMPTRLAYADGACMLNAVVFEVDEQTGKTVGVERIDVR